MTIFEQFLMAIVNKGCYFNNGFTLLRLTSLYLYKILIMSNNFSIIESKLNKFQNKFNLDCLIKGLIIFILALIIPSVILLLFESALYIGVSVKRILIYSFLFYSVGIFIYWVALPFLRYLSVFSFLNKERANKIIVNHFPDIKDHLWNVIELQKTNSENYSDELLLASINQKIDEIKHFNFSDAVQLKGSFKKFILIVGLFIGLLLMVVLIPGISKGPATRLVYFNQSFFRPSPYTYTVLNDSLKIGKGENITLKVKVSSKELMNDLYINIAGNQFRMNRDSSSFFSYEFINLNQSVHFDFVMNQYHSDQYHIEVLPKPILETFKVSIEKPNYTHLGNETFENLTEFTVPIGSFITIEFTTYDTEFIYYKLNDLTDSTSIELINKNKFKQRFQVKGNQQLFYTFSNKSFIMSDLLQLNFKTILDEYPTISVVSAIDSLTATRYYFKGTINDDYGFSNLNFRMKIDGKRDSVISLPLNKNILLQQFFYAFDFSELKDSASFIEYYFDISDNDVINGPKISSSQVLTFRFPNFKEIIQEQADGLKDVNKDLNQGLALAAQLQKEINALQQKLIDSNLTNWEKGEAIKSIVDKRNQLESIINEALKKNSEINNFMNSFTDQNKELLDKQNQIQNLLENMLSDEMKKMLDEFNKMVDQFNQDKFNNLNKDMNISLDDLSKQLDNSLEMLKKVQIESKLNQLKDELAKISDQQQRDIKKLDDKKNDGLSTSQADLQKRMNDVIKEYQKTKEDNSELNEPLKLNDFDNEFNEMDKEFQQTLSDLDKKKSSNAKKSMQKNKEKMDNLEFMMEQVMEQNFSEQRSENIEDLQQILENLVRFSMNQEKVLIPLSSQFFQGNTLVIQKKLNDDFKVISDSLYALQLREPSIGSVVNKEITSIQSNFASIENEFSENRPYNVSRFQQLIMTSSNNLALFIEEVITQLQKQEGSSSSSGNKNCNKPGSGKKPSFNSMKQMQQAMQSQMEKMMQMIKSGQNSGMNGELGKALSQQEMMQKMIRDMMNSEGVGSGAYETLKAADQLLNNLRNDILRNNISNETLNRQKQIMTRLLEAEKAENEREKEEKRESNTAKKQFTNELPKYFENTRSNNTFEERLLKDKLLLKQFYQKKYQQYIFKLDSINAQ